MKLSLIIPALGSWSGPARAEFFNRVLTGEGHEVQIFPAAKGSCPSANQLRGSRVVFNHAMQAPPEKIKALAKTLTETNFVNVNHSAIPHLERDTSRFVDKFTASIHSARLSANVWYASQDPVAEDVGQAAMIDRAIWLPVPCNLLEPREYRPPAAKAKVVLAGRCDSIKNNLNQIIACAMLRDSIELVICMDIDRTLKNLLHALGFEATIKGLMPHSDWLDFLRTEADVVLCGSLAESYGFVAAEAMQTGVPVVTSSAIRFGDPSLRFPVNTPAWIAEKITEAIDSHEELAKTAITLGRLSAEEQLSGYLRQVAWLCEQ